MYKISPTQFMLLVALFSIGTTILILPASLVYYAKQDAWVAIIIGVGLSSLLIKLYTSLAKPYPDFNWVSLSEKLLGKWFGKLVTLFWLLNSFITVPTQLYYIGAFIKTQMMPETPAIAISCIFASIMVIAMRYGLVTLGRAAEVLLPLVIILFLFMLIMLVPEMKIDNLQPVMETPWKRILRAALDYVAFSTLPIVFLLMIFPANVDKLNEGIKAFFIGILIGGFVLLLMTLATVTILSQSTASEAYPSYALAKKINIGGFITRVEAVVATIWFITVFFKMTLYFYASVAGFAQLMKVTDYRVLVIPLGIIAIVLSTIIYPSSAFQGKWDEQIWPPFIATSGLLFPIVLLIAHMIRRYLKRNKEKQ